MPISETCVGSALLPKSMNSEKEVFFDGPATNNGALPLYQPQASSHTRSVVVHHTIPTSGRLYTASPGPLLRSNLQSPSLAPPAPADECLRLGSARWHLLSEGVFPLCPCKPVAAPTLRLQSYPFVPVDLTTKEGTSQCAETFTLSQLAPRDSGSIPVPLALSFSFLLLSYLVT